MYLWIDAMPQIDRSTSAFIILKFLFSIMSEPHDMENIFEEVFSWDVDEKAQWRF